MKNVDPVLVRETVSQSTSDFICEALFQTVESDDGTGKAGRVAGYKVGGKTGTARRSPVLPRTISFPSRASRRRTIPRSWCMS